MIGKETQAPFRFSALVSGTTMKSVQFVITANGIAPTYSLSSATVVFYKDGARTLTLTVGNGITINNAATWTFTVGPIAASRTSLAVGDHSGSFKTTDANGGVQEYLFLTLPVLPTAPPA
jgi:hypothetical protein